MLFMKIGHKGDMYFVCTQKENVERYVITKVFYDKEKCLQYLEKQNRYRSTNDVIR